MRKIFLAAFVCIFMGTLVAKADLEPTKIYAYGFAASFNDSTVYMTEIMEIDSAWVDSKNGFLYSRDNYSYQLRMYLNDQGEPTPTCIISFAKDRKTAEKKYMALRKRYTENKDVSYLVKYISTDDFKFEAISAANDTEAQNQAKIGDKKLRKERKAQMKAKNKEQKEKEKQLKEERKKKEKEIKEDRKHPEPPRGERPKDFRR